MIESVLRLTHVSKKFLSGDSELLILEHIDLVLEMGRSVAITGKSGSGKSTLLNLVGGLDSPTSGAVYLRNRKLSDMRDKELSEFRNKNIGFVFQSHILLDDFSALENVCVPALIGGQSARVASQRAKELLDRVGLADRMNHRPQKLSGGERQRVAICRALINKPELIIADEPTGSLDEESSGEIERLLLDLVREEEKTLLLVTHDQQLAKKCDVVYLLHNRVLQEMA